MEKDNATTREGRLLDGFIALMLESEFDKNTRTEGWVEMKNSNPKYLQWAITMCDTTEDEFRRGLLLGNLVYGPKRLGTFSCLNIFEIKLWQEI